MRYKLLKDIGVFKKDTILKTDEIPIEKDGIQTFETAFYIILGNKLFYPTKLVFQKNELESFIEQGYVGLIEEKINKEDLMLDNLNYKIEKELLKPFIKDLSEQLNNLLEPLNILNLINKGELTLKELSELIKKYQDKNKP